MQIQAYSCNGHLTANLYYTNIYISQLTLLLKCGEIYCLHSDLNRVTFPKPCIEQIPVLHIKFTHIYFSSSEIHKQQTIYIWKAFLKILDLYSQHSSLCCVCMWIIINKCLNSFSVTFCCFVWLLMLSLDICWYLPEMWIIKILLPRQLIQQWNSEYKTYSMK